MKPNKPTKPRLTKDKPGPSKGIALRKLAEKRLAAKGQSKTRTSIPADDAQLLIHELQVHQIELEMQNEELRKTQQELEESRSRYSDLYDFAPVGYFTFDQKGLIHDVNLTGATLLGVERSTLIKKRFPFFIAPEHKYPFYQHCQQVIKTGTQQTCEIVLVRKDGARFFAQLESTAVKEPSGNPGHCRTVVTDITERKQSEQEQALKRMRMLLSEGQRIAHCGSWEYIAETQETVWSEEECRIYGIDPAGPAPVYQDMLRNNIHPDDAALLDQTFRQALRDRSVFELEHRAVRPDGSMRVLYDIAHPYLDDNGRLIKYIGATLDITERTQFEKKIQLQNAILQGINRIFEATLTSPTESALGQACLDVAAEITGSKFGFIGEVREDGLYDIAISNPGWEACKLIDESGHRRPPGIFTMHGIYGRVIKDGKGLFSNDPASHPDRIGFPPGHPPLESFLGVPLLREGIVTGLVAVGNREGGYSPEQLEALETLAPAIEEAFSRKRAERSLIESEERLRLSQQVAKIGIFEWNVQTGVNIWSPELEAMYGLATGEFGRTQPAWEQLVHSEDRAAAKGLVNQTFETGEPAEGEWRVVWRDGSVHWILGRFQAFKDAAGTPLRLSGVNLDITERKQAEEALSRSEERTRIAMEIGGIGSFDRNLLTNTVVWDEQAKWILGLTESTTDPAALGDLIHPDDRAKLYSKMEQSLHSKKRDVDLTEFRIIRPDGQLCWVAALGRIFYDESTDPPLPLRRMGVIQDITGRKKAEEKLQESEERFRTMVNAMPQLAWIAPARRPYLLVQPALV